MPSTYGLVRISDKHRQADGPSIEVQCQTVLGWCNAHGAMMAWDSSPGMPHGIFADIGKSAYKAHVADRPEASKLLRKLKPGDRVVVARIDRIFRNMLDFCITMEEFKRRDITLVVCEPEIDFSTACGRLLAHLMAAFAEFESAIKSERVKAANTAKGTAKKGRKTRKLQSVDGDYTPMTKAIRDKLPPGGRIWIYRRVSHADQVESGKSLEWQKRVGLEEADKIIEQRPHMALGGEFVDLGVSATKTNLRDRPEGRKLYEIVKPGDIVIFPKLDRGFRNTRDMLNTLPDWIEAGIEVRILDQQLDFSRWTGMIVLETLSLAARIEAAITSARNKEVKEYLDSHGRPSGKIPPFFKVVKVHGKRRMTWDRRQFAIAKMARWLYRLGVGHDEIADRLEACLARRENREPRKKFATGSQKREWSIWQIKQRFYRLDDFERSYREHRLRNRMQRRGVTVPKMELAPFAALVAGRQQTPVPAPATGQ